jgi:hypothetical protein
MTIMGRLKDQTLPKTLAYIEKRHGTLSKQDFDELTRQAKTAKFTGPEKFVAEAALLTLTFSKLTRGLQGVSDYLKMEYLRKCTSTQPAIQDAINDYEKDCLHKDTNATYSGMVAYVEVQAPLVTSKSLGYSASAAVPPVPATPTPQTTDHYVAYAQGYAAGKQQGQTTGGRGGHGRGGAQETGRGVGRGRGAAAPRKYCFLHGSRGHTGAECRAMTKEGPDADKSFSDDMRAATGPCTLSGWEGAKA